MKYPLHCDATVTRRATAWGFADIPCGQVVGIVRFLDESSEWRAYCHLPGHAYDVVRRYGRLVTALRREAAFEATCSDLRELAEAEGIPDVPLADPDARMLMYQAEGR